MTHPFQTQLAHIRETLLLMSTITDKSLGLAIRALVERDDQKADQVEEEDSKIDELEMQVDELVVTYMATHGPMATDCRLMLAASKISSDLERIGDQATTIARRARDLNKEPLLKPLIDIPKMAELAQQMLRDGITAFIEADADFAQQIIARDKSVDDMNRQTARELTTYMMEDPRSITRALHLMTISKALERVADHAANIAEDVYFLYRGEDIRHGRLPH